MEFALTSPATAAVSATTSVEAAVSSAVIAVAVPSGRARGSPLEASPASATRTWVPRTRSDESQRDDGRDHEDDYPRRYVTEEQQGDPEHVITALRPTHTETLFTPAPLPPNTPTSK